MSAAGVLKWGSSRAVGSAATAERPCSEEDALSGIDPGLICLARQLFLAVPRRRVFFVAPGDEVDVSELCILLGTVLSRLFKEKVALVDTSDDAPSGAAVEDHSPRNNTIQGAEVPLPNYLWRLPAYAFEQKFEQGCPTGELDLPFAYVLFAGKIAEGAAPLFCRASEGCVLVVAAHRTHRQAALRAKEILQDWNARLLGIVLTNRTFPVPECIYRRL